MSVDAHGYGDATVRALPEFEIMTIAKASPMLGQIDALSRLDADRLFIIQLIERPADTWLDAIVVGPGVAVALRRSGVSVEAHARLARLGGATVGALSDTIFRSAGGIRYLTFRKMYRIDDPENIRFPVDEREVALDNWMRLPPTVAEYDRTLEPEYRKRLHYYRRRFAREFPSSRFVTLVGERIPVANMERHYEFQRLRLTETGRKPRIDTAYARHSSGVLQRYGRFHELLDGDAFCAGVMVLDAGKAAMLGSVTINNHYQKYSPGAICLYQAIEASIRRGCSEFHFLWGEDDYKRRLGGRLEPVYDYTVMRTAADKAFLVPQTIRRGLHAWARSLYRTTIKPALRKR
jgi:hypothetical protein